MLMQPSQGFGPKDSRPKRRPKDPSGPGWHAEQTRPAVHVPPTAQHLIWLAPGGIHNFGTEHDVLMPGAA
jgi:hypothetical protein